MASKSKQIQFIQRYCKRYFVDATSAMALGLFSSLIIGLIISQFGKIPYCGFLDSFAAIVKSGPVVGGAIGAAIAYGLKAKPLVIFSCVAVGAFGYDAGGPVGAYLATLVGAEVARTVSGRTKVDIVLISDCYHYFRLYCRTICRTTGKLCDERPGQLGKQCNHLLPILHGHRYFRCCWYGTDLAHQFCGIVHYVGYFRHCRRCCNHRLLRPDDWIRSCQLPR